MITTVILFEMYIKLLNEDVEVYISLLVLVILKNPPFVNAGNHLYIKITYQK